MQPQPRNARHRDRQSIEKDMLQSRTGHFHRFERQGSILPLDPSAPSSLPSKYAYMSTEEIASFEKLDRDHERAIKEEKIERKRAEAYYRDTLRQAEFERNYQMEQDRLKRSQQDPVKVKKITGSIPYDIVTMEYHNTPEGQTLAYHDQLVDYRRDLRSSFLAAKNHLGFNCITGEQMVDIKIPKRPEPPSS